MANISLLVTVGPAVRLVIYRVIDFSRNRPNELSGADRIHAILPGIPPCTQDRYLSAWRHWVGFMHGQGGNHWVARRRFNWDGDLVDFMLFEAKMMGNASPAIAGKISSVRFWHVVSGYPDFPIGG